MRSGAMAAMALAAILAGCAGDDDGGADGGGDGERLQGSGTLVEQARTVSPFHGVRLESVGKVLLATAAEQGVVVEVDDNLVDRIRTEVVDGVLTVALAPGNYQDLHLTVKVAAPVFDEVALQGAGSIEGSVGTVSSLSVSTSGAGDVTLSGVAEEALIEHTGVGAVHAFDLLTGSCSVTLRGTGQVEVAVSNRLFAVLSGTGDLVYAGDPVVTGSVTGVGQVRRR